MSDRNRDKEKLRRLVNGDRVSHAYMITGPDGEGFAAGMAAALVCEGAEKPCGRCSHCKKTALGIHPDIITVSLLEGKREILVDQVRDLRSDAYIRPNEARRKIYIIQPAETMNANAQNAFLKVLEEGPAYAVFLLVTRQAGALLPTVRSRCEEIFLQPAEENRTSYGERAVELAELLLEGKEQKLLTCCVGLEKLSREEMISVLEQTVSILEEKIKENVHSAQKIIPIIEKLKILWDAAQFNTGVGHLAGWLCAAVFE